MSSMFLAEPSTVGCVLDGIGVGEGASQPLAFQTHIAFVYVSVVCGGAGERGREDYGNGGGGSCVNYKLSKYSARSSTCRLWMTVNCMTQIPME